MNQRVGTIQLQDIQGDVTKATSAICNALAEADKAGVTILCFPECFLQGYTLDLQVTKKRALNFDSSEFQAFLDKLAPYKATAIIGIIEKDNDAYFNTAVVVRNGELIGSYRKTHLFEENFQPGTEYPVFTVDSLIFGVNICYDARFSEGAIALADKGAQAIFYPLNNRLPDEKAAMYRDKHIVNLIDRAQQTHCWIISSDVIAQDEDYTSYGCTAIVSPDGVVVSQVLQLQTGLISAVVDIR